MKSVGTLTPSVGGSPSSAGPSTNDADEEDNAGYDQSTLYAGDKALPKTDEGNVNRTLGNVSTVPLSYHTKSSTGGFGSRSVPVGLERPFRPAELSTELDLRYSPPVGTPNVFRTVLVTNLPKITSTTQILDHVHEGPIIDIKLARGNIFPGSSVAIIQFLFNNSARHFVTHTANYDVIIGDKKINALLLNTPTRPIPPHLFNSILQGKLTRVLSIFQLGRDFSSVVLHHDIGSDSPTNLSTVDCIKMTSLGFVEICFTSINGARLARDFLMAHRRYRDCAIRFGPDPCATLNSAEQCTQDVDFVRNPSNIPIGQDIACKTPRCE